MDCPMCGMGMGFWMVLGALLGVALLVLMVVSNIRLWPRRSATFTSSEPAPKAGERQDDVP